MAEVLEDNSSALEAFLKPNGGSDPGDECLLRRSRFQEIEKARDLTWRDSFYDDQAGIVGVFDFQDSSSMAKWVFREYVAIYFLLCYIAICWYPDNAAFGMLVFLGVGAVVLVQCFRAIHAIQANQNKNHVAVTTEGVRMDNTKGNKVTTTIIPFQDIQSVGLHSLFTWNSSSPLSGVLILRTPTQSHHSESPSFRIRCLSMHHRRAKRLSQHVLLIEQRQEFVALVEAMKNQQGAT